MIWKTVAKYLTVVFICIYSLYLILIVSTGIMASFDSINQYLLGSYAFLLGILLLNSISLKYLLFALKRRNWTEIVSTGMSCSIKDNQPNKEGRVKGIRKLNFLVNYTFNGQKQEKSFSMSKNVDFIDKVYPSIKGGNNEGTLQVLLYQNPTKIGKTSYQKEMTNLEVLLAIVIAVVELIWFILTLNLIFLENNLIIKINESHQELVPGYMDKTILFLQQNPIGYLFLLDVLFLFFNICFLLICIKINGLKTFRTCPWFYDKEKELKYDLMKELEKKTTVCYQCGAKIEKKEIFCSNCGKQVV